MLIEDLILPGERDCLRDCRCTVEYRKASPDDRIDTLVKKVQNGGTLTEKEINELADEMSNNDEFIKELESEAKESRAEAVAYSLNRLRDDLNYARLLAISLPEKFEEWNEGNEAVQALLENDWLGNSQIIDILRDIQNDNQMTPVQSKHYQETIAILRKHKPLLEKMEFYIPEAINNSPLHK